MVILTGENLGKRQQDLNKQTRDAFTRKDDFENIKKEPNSTDQDVLFKIDLASHYKNFDYLLATFKSGDSLHISRALKCTWLYDDEYSNIINVDYLHHNIFPSMSFKMQRKFLITISMYLRNEMRAESFYTYCIRVKLPNVASKFLIFTSEFFKIEVIRTYFDRIVAEDELFYINFVGKSFALATAIMEEASEYPRSKIIYYLRHLMSVSENDYLDLLETFDCPQILVKRLGLRISTNIIKKHSRRILKHPFLYVQRLNKNIITKYITVEHAKNIAAQILPGDSEIFWRFNFYKQYDFLLKIIPTEERFRFVKKLFNEKYPNKEFEMSEEFFNLRYYELMTVDEREIWALCHIETNTEIQGVGRNYLWYEYVSFEKAFPEIKKVISKKPDANERHEVVQVLVNSVRNPKDMKDLLTYYYDRHVNETQIQKEQFVEAIINVHNVLEFNNDCWIALNKLLHSMKVYRTSEKCGSSLIMSVVVMYHIIHNIDLPNVLKEYILKSNRNSSIDKKIFKEKLSIVNQEQVYQYIVKVYIDEITSLHNEEYRDDKKIVPYVLNYLYFLEEHKKSLDDCPDFVMEFVEANFSYYQDLSLFKKNHQDLTQTELIRQLKQDLNLVVENISEVKNQILQYQYPPYQINIFLKKIKVYFPHDVTQQYLKMFMETLKEKENMTISTICTLVYGIFQLGDDQTKIDFMTKYAPTNAKVKHDEIDERLLGIQEGICRSFCFSRPPVPLSNVLKYIKGDYLRFCLPIFQSYQANLPQPLLQQFVTKLIDAPVSVQKHALRLVFECFSIENLKTTIHDSWKRTKNVSLRFVLYQSLCHKIRSEDENIKVELFEILKKFTAELKDDDNVELYNRYMNDIYFLPEVLRGEYIIICWKTVSKFSNKTENLRIKNKIIVNMTNFIHLLDGNDVKEIVENYVKHMLVDKNIRPKYENKDLSDLYEAKWKLVVTYIIYFSSDVNFVHKNMDFVKFIIIKCIELWHEINEEIFTFRNFCWKFIDDLIATTTLKCCSDAIPIFETILTVLKDNFAITEIYRQYWSLKLTILRRSAKKAIKINYDSNSNSDLLALVRLAIHDYGIRVGKLVQENVNLKSYCVSMNDVVGEMIKDNISNITFVDINDKGILYHESLRDIDILVAEGLTEVPIVETYLLALYILPLNSDLNSYAKILNKIKYFESLEVQTCWNNKFVYNDFKRRKLE